MNPSDHQQEARAKAIYLRAIDKENAVERAAYIEGACADEPSLFEKVNALIKAHVEDSFLEAPAIEGITTLEETSLSEGPGTVIGRYKLLQKVGEGGMGVVYMAEQTEPVTRKVALKIIKLGMDTKQVVARFEAERQALAMMDHPNIAKVLDAGATDTGRPYFVMELVRGVPITEYCDKNKLSTQERLNLFIPVCQAIQHAHQKGVIHRDIKPSNVMVTLNDGEPHPMVIDFGIAKATNQKLTEKTLFTNYAQMIGTPAYMSPEQAEMSKLDVDTRTDVYSLGVLLYELLTGTTPFPSKELLSLGYGEMQKVIAEKEPPKPSTRLSTMQHEERTVVAKNRSVEVSALGRAFKGDLDWIVMKALEKDRSHRYDTANGLAADITRHLSNEPVVARPPSQLYRLEKMMRRNKTVFVAAGAVFVALVIGLLLSLYLFVQEKAALKRAVAAELQERQLRQRAEHSQEESRQIARAGLMLMSGKYDESEQTLRGIPPHTALVPFYNMFGRVHAQRSEWLESLTNWNLVIKYAPRDHMGYTYVAPLLLQLDDVASYKNLRTQILRQFGNTSDPRIAERMVSASLLLPPTADEMRVIAKLADVAITGDTNSDGWGFNLFAKGFAEYRQGHFATAAEWLQRIPPLDAGWNCRTEAYLVLAMAQFQLNQPKSSRASFAEAVRGLTQKMRKAGHLDEQWNAWIAVHLLMREAAALMPMAAKPESSPNHGENQPVP